MELLKTNGFDGLAEAVTVLLNSAMVAERLKIPKFTPPETWALGDHCIDQLNVSVLHPHPQRR